MRDTRTAFVVEVYSTRHGGLAGRGEFLTAAEAATFVATFADDNGYLVEDLGERPVERWW